MATSPITIRPAPDQTKTHRRGLALAVAAVLLVGGGVAAAAVNDDHTAPVPRHVGGTLAASDVDGSALLSGVSSREYSARLRTERLSRALPSGVSSREYSARLRTERLSRAH